MARKKNTTKNDLLTWYMEFVLDNNQQPKSVFSFAKENNFKQLYLYSNTKLENAIHIYLKYGFIEANIPTNNPYKRSNIKMVYPL